MGREILQNSPKREIPQSEVREIFTGLTAGLPDVREKGERIITRYENTRVLFAPLASADVKTTFSASNLTANAARPESEINCEGLEGTGTKDPD